MKYQDFLLILILIRNRLFPVLRQSDLPRGQPDLKKWVTTMIAELRNALSILIPLSEEEIKFITAIRDSGQIKPELLTSDKQLIQTIQTHPAILWATKKQATEK